MLAKTASMSMLTLFESRYTLKGRYSIGNVGKTASMSMLTLIESRYTLKGRYSIFAKLLIWVCLVAYSLWIRIESFISMQIQSDPGKIYIEGKVQHFCKTASMSVLSCLLSLKGLKVSSQCRSSRIQADPVSRKGGALAKKGVQEENVQWNHEKSVKKTFTVPSIK